MPASDLTDLQSTGTLPVTGEGAVPVPAAPPAAGEKAAWLPDARAQLPAPGRYLAWQLDGTAHVVALDREVTRIGRSLSAEIRFDDATVSRRHALVTSQPEGARVHDDRSLNGVCVNGRRVEDSPLADGDELLVGRHVLYYLEAAGPEPGSAPERA